MEDLIIGTRIAELRKKLNLTQNELADKLMISNKAVSKWESNYGAPSLEMLIKLHEVLNCSLDYLILGEDTNKQTQTYDIPLILGKDENGKEYKQDLCELIHCLIGGEVGSGKSNLLHNIITQLISNFSKDELKLALVDGKGIDFEQYKNIPNLFSPVANSAEDIYDTLTKVVNEINNRFDTLMALGCRNKKDFEKSYPNSKLPYIVIIIDELAEVILNKNIQGENLIDRITRLGRPAGIYLIAATYRIKPDVLTESISQNLLTKIAFKMKEDYEYTICLKTPNHPIVNNIGEMIVAPQNSIRKHKIKCPYILPEEIDNIIKNIR